MKHLKIFTCLLVATLFFASCDDDDDDNSLSFSKDYVEVTLGEEVTVTVKNAATGEFAITTDKKHLSAVQVEGTKDIKIVGIAEGETVISVKDAAGKLGNIKVVVLDAKTRFVWDTLSKVKGTDEGDYTLEQKEGKATFTWTNGLEGEEAQSIVLSFSDDAKLAVGAKKDAKLTVDGEDTPVSGLEVKFNKVITEDAGITIWVEFKANDKVGTCVATVNAGEEPVKPEA